MNSLGLFRVQCDIQPSTAHLEQFSRNNPDSRIMSLWGIHLTGVRDVAAATDQTLVPGRGSPGCLKSPTPTNGYATRTSSAPESPASTPPVLVRQPRASRVVHRPPAANNHMGNSAYMDTPDVAYSDIGISVTPSSRDGCCAGIKPAPMSISRSWLWRPTSATPRSPTPTGTAGSSAESVGRIEVLLKEVWVG